MKKKLLNLLLVLLLLVTIPGAMVLASDISGALYRMGITVSNNGTLATYVSTTGNISTPNLIAGNYSNAAVDNIAVQDAGGSDVIFMPGHTTNPWCFWVETIGADSYVNYNLYTAESTNGTIAYFPDTTGMIVSDNSTLELDNDFEIETLGWVDTDAGASKDLVFKDGSFTLEVSDATNITATMDSGGFAAVFPTVDATSQGSVVVNATNHTVTYPAGLTVGDLLMVFFTTDEIPVITPPAAVGFTTLWDEIDGNNNHRGACYYKVIDGTEGTSDVFVTANAQMTSYVCFRISGYSGVPEKSAVVTATSNAPNSGNLAPSWGNQWTLWMSHASYDGTGQNAAVVWPIGYVNNNINEIPANNEGADTVVSTQNLAAANSDPSAYTMTGPNYWIAHTVGIAPAEDLATVTVAGVASGELQISASADAVNLTLDVENMTSVDQGNSPQSVGLGGVSCDDNNNDWEFFLNGAMPYAYSANITVGGVPISAWEWQYDTIFYDSIGVNDATPSFRTTSSDADIIATAVSFVPVEEATAPAWTLDTTVATWVTAPAITGNFTTTPGPTYPGASVIIDIAAASGTPAQLPFTILFGFLVLAFSLIVTYLMRQSSVGSLLVKFLVIAFAMWIGIVLNVVDFWMLLFFIFMAIAILSASKQGALV